MALFIDMKEGLNKFLFLLCAIAVFSSIGTKAAFCAQAKATCITDKCHADKGKDKFVHGPVAVGECLVCHTKTGDHKFAPMKKDKEELLCYKCHPDRINRTKGAHKQVKDGYCSKCHDPHQSPNRYQIRK